MISDSKYADNSERRKMAALHVAQTFLAATLRFAIRSAVDPVPLEALREAALSRRAIDLRHMSESLTCALRRARRYALVDE